MSLFTLTASCPIFAPSTCDGTPTMNITFQRAAHILEGRAITVNSAGETVLSFVEVDTITGSLQPAGGNYVRMIQGTIMQIDAMFFVMGNPDIQVADRCTVSAVQMEAINVQHYGLEHAEISLHHVGR